MTREKALKKKIVVHCETEMQWALMLDWAKVNGYTWSGGEEIKRPGDDNVWKANYKEDMIINLSNEFGISYGTTQVYGNAYTIMSFDEFMKKEEVNTIDNYSIF